MVLWSCTSHHTRCTVRSPLSTYVDAVSTLSPTAVDRRIPRVQDSYPSPIPSEHASKGTYRKVWRDSVSECCNETQGCGAPTPAQCDLHWPCGQRQVIDCRTTDRPNWWRLFRRGSYHPCAATTARAARIHSQVASLQRDCSAAGKPGAHLAWLCDKLQARTVHAARLCILAAIAFLER